MEVNGWECHVEASDMVWGKNMVERLHLSRRDSVLAKTGAGAGACAPGANSSQSQSPVKSKLT